MREIKFRAWDEDGHMINMPFHLHLKDGMTMLLEPSGTFGYQGSSVTLMQYTGLKDKNGKEIYEGDIVNQYADYKSPVIYQDGSFMTDIDEGYRLELSQNGNFSSIEVIGNIYENKELLK